MSLLISRFSTSFAQLEYNLEMRLRAAAAYAVLLVFALLERRDVSDQPPARQRVPRD